MLSLMRSARFHTLAIVCIICAAGSGCSVSPQAKEAKFLKRGSAYLAQKDDQRAILEFLNAAKANTKDAEPLYQLAIAYGNVGRLTDAYAALKKAADLNPQHAGVQTKLAELMATSRDAKMAAEARQHAERAATTAPRDPDALYAVALTEYRLGETENAEAQLKKTLSQFPENLQSAQGLATIYLGRKDFAAAEDILRKAAQQKPESAAAILALADLYAMEDKRAEAENEYRHVLRVDPNNGAALSKIGELQFANGRKMEAEQTFRQVAGLPDKTYEATYAFFLVREERIGDATAEFQRLAKKDPRDRLARSRLVTAYLSQNKLEDARKVLTAVLETNPKDASALFQRSEIFLRLRRFAEAKQDLTEVLRINPDRAQAHYLLSEVSKAQGADLIQRQELSEALRLKPDLLIARIALAHAFVSSKESKAAITVLDQGPEDQKQTAEYVAARNWALMAAHNSTEARKGIDKGLGSSRTPELLLQDAVLKLQEKHYEQADAALESLLKANPANSDALRLLAASYKDQKQPAVALRKVREYAAMVPGSFALQVFAADWFFKNGNLSDASAAITAAKTADPRSVVPDLILAQAEWARGKPDKARSRVTAILSIDQQNLGAHLLLAMIEDNSGNYAEAVVHYRRVVELDPRQGVALNGLAYDLGSYTTQLDEALKFAQRAKDLDPESSQVDDTLGWIMFRMGQYRSAQEFLVRASSKNPDPVIKYHLAMACYKLGEVSRGQQLLLAALQANDKLPEAAQALAVFGTPHSNSR